MEAWASTTPTLFLALEKDGEDKFKKAAQELLEATNTQLDAARGLPDELPATKMRD